ncbi:MAG: PIN domain-containing protein [Armatimonadota bacterium]|nr:PIN domain-containing protein [Armatimonadota bacterium]MDR7550122.1 PIN domain-containing protein [Armatimonadota bacterium]
MRKHLLLRAVGVLLGGIAGYQAVQLAALWNPSIASTGFLVTSASIAGGGLVGLLVFPSVARGFSAAMAWLLYGMAGLSLRDLVLAASGLLTGLVLAYVVGALLDGLPLVGPYMRPVAGVVLGYLGLHLALQRREEVAGILPRDPHRAESDRAAWTSTPKLLDTSVIIDGRIAEICLSGFLEGPLLVPRSVLAELQRIADSADVLRRNRGRRGLDILNRLQKELAALQILEDTGGADVDAQLVALARAHRAAIVTTDFNLSKVAELQGVRVLNVHQLAQALRPTVMPGEELSVHVLRDGKEAGQGIAYLEDGTMIVVEGGKRLIGETSDVVVTSVLQTSAGRMIFARPKSSEPAGPPSVKRR